MSQTSLSRQLPYFYAWGVIGYSPATLGVTSCEYIDEPYIVKAWSQWATQLRRHHHPRFICFDTIPACDGRTDRMLYM